MVERRANERLFLARPCKLYVPRIGRYVPGSTWNISSGGAMLQLDRSIPFEPGDQLFVGIALKRRQAVLPVGEMLQAGVVRVARTARDGTALAVRFLAAQHEAGFLRRAA